jgi:polar amino acid transport system permease protein
MIVWDWDYTGEILPDLIHGLGVTVVVTLLSFIVAIAVGFIWAGLRRANSLVVNRLAKWTVDFIRGTPLLVQIFAVFYIFPAYGLTLTAFQAGVLAIGLHYSAYVSETYRSAILSVDRSQWEAAAVLGLFRWRLWWSVVIPQAFRAAVPTLANYLIWIYKETALLFVLGIPVLIQVAQVRGTATFRYLEPLTIAGLLYFAVSYLSALSFRRLERRKWTTR